jgi:hypothetical protein
MKARVRKEWARAQVWQDIGNNTSSLLTSRCIWQSCIYNYQPKRTEHVTEGLALNRVYIFLLPLQPVYTPGASITVILFILGAHLNRSLRKSTSWSVPLKPSISTSWRALKEMVWALQFWGWSQEQFGRHGFWPWKGRKRWSFVAINYKPRSLHTVL